MTWRNNRDDALEHLMRTGPELAGREPIGPCPDAELMAAFVERALPPGEASELEGHAASCSRCQAQLAALARSEPEAGTRGATAWLVPWRWLVPATAAAAAGLLLWVAVDPTDRPFQPELALEERIAAPADRAETAANPPSPSAASAPGSPDGALTPKVDTEAERSRVQPDQAPVARGAQADAALAAPGPNTPGLGDVGAPAATEFAPPAEPRASRAVRPTPSEPAVVRQLQVAPPGVAVTDSAAPGAGPVEVVSPTDPTVRWAIGPGAAIARTTDAGASWQSQDSGVTAELLAGASPGSTVCWVVGRGGTISRSTDGTSWTSVPSPTEADLIDVQATDADAAVVSTMSGERFRTRNGGIDWERVP